MFLIGQHSDYNSFHFVKIGNHSEKKYEKCSVHLWGYITRQITLYLKWHLIFDNHLHIINLLHKI